MKKTVSGCAMHLTLDGYGCSHEQLTDRDLVFLFLDKCHDLIDMTKSMPPYVFEYHGKVREDWGLSGFVRVYHPGVHLSLHTFPDKGYLSLDIFSNREFDQDKAIAFATELFSITHAEKCGLRESTKERIAVAMRRIVSGEPPDEVA